MKLLEIFNSTYDAKLSFNDDEIKASFRTADGDLINVEWAEYQSDRASVKANVFVLEFSRNSSIETTGQGDALKIFSTVAELTKQVLNREEPGALVFLSSKSEDSRVSLYKKFSNRFSHPKYKTISNLEDVKQPILKKWLSIQRQIWNGEHEIITFVHKDNL